MSSDTKAEERSLRDWKEAAVVCKALDTKLAQSDCLFHIAESLPVHVDRYETAAKNYVLCRVDFRESVTTTCC